MASHRMFALALFSGFLVLAQAAAAVPLLVDEFDDGNLATNNGVGSGFDPESRTAFAVVDENSTVPGAVYIDMQGDPAITGLGGIRSIDTFAPSLMLGEITRVTWSVNAASNDPGQRHILSFTDGMFARRLEVDFFGSTASLNANEISFLFNDGASGIITEFQAPHGVDWSTSFDVVVEVSAAGYTVDWGFGSQSGPWSGGFDFAIWAAPGLHVYALAGEEQGTGTTSGILALDRITVETIVPEPSAAALLLLATSGFFARCRTKARTSDRARLPRPPPRARSSAG